MITGQFALEEHFVQGFEEQMYGGKHFSRIFMFLINGERGCRSELFIRGCFERNGSAQNGSRDRVNGKPIRTFAERFHTAPFQSPV